MANKVAIPILGISGFLGYSMAKVERVPIEENPALLGLKYEDVSFSSRDDELTLRGWYLPAQNSELVVIMVHGGEQHRADPSIGMLDIASGLVEHGYRLQRASQNPQNQLWVVPEAAHVSSYVNHPEEYMNKITTFLDEVFKVK